MAFGFNTRPQGGQPVTPAPRSVPPTEMQQSSGFTDALRQPEVQAALIQFGINMLNPTYDGFGGQLGRSIGAAGAAAGRASGQKQEREDAAHRRRIQESELGLAERRVSGAEKREERLSRFGGSGGLTSMFSKPKPFPQWLHDMAKLEVDRSLGELSANDLINDPEFVDRAYQGWLQANQRGMGQVGSGGQEGGGVVPGGPARISSQEEFESLPSGALFVNPADGRVLRKK